MPKTEEINEDAQQRRRQAKEILIKDNYNSMEKRVKYIGELLGVEYGSE